MSTPEEFFTAVEEEEGDKLCTWRGELYLEMHNGTYTTHAKVTFKLVFVVFSIIVQICLINFGQMLMQVMLK